MDETMDNKNGNVTFACPDDRRVCLCFWCHVLNLFFFSFSQSNGPFTQVYYRIFVDEYRNRYRERENTCRIQG